MAQQQLPDAAGIASLAAMAAALRALRGGKHADALLREELHEPDSVLPEERYRLIVSGIPASLAQS